MSGMQWRHLDYSMHTISCWLPRHTRAVSLACRHQAVFWSAVSILEAHYRDVVDGFISGERVKARISTSLLEGVDLAILKCDVCHMESMVVHLMVNIRFHHTLREYNRHLCDNKSRKNRKTLKVCHV